MKKILKRIGLLSVFKISFVIGLILGFFIGAVYALMFSLAGLFAIIGVGGDEAAAGGLMLIAIALVMMIVISLIYAVFSGVGSMVYAFIYNLLAKFVGGVELELEDKAEDKKE